MLALVRQSKPDEDAGFDCLEDPESAGGVVDRVLHHVVMAEAGADALECARVGLGHVAGLEHPSGDVGSAVEGEAVVADLAGGGGPTRRPGLAQWR